MSGHSKWATTKRQKAVTDAKRSSLFTKLAKNITIAAKDGADPDMNFKLRVAVDQAKTFSMPKDNIERAIARGAGTTEGVVLETILYEAYGPGGIGLLIETITDNKNRSVSNLKAILNKHGGTLGSSGSVLWQFQLRGLIRTEQKNLNEDQQSTVIDWGVEDIQSDEHGTEILCAPEQLEKLKKQMAAAGWPISEARLEYRAKDLQKSDHAEAVINLLEALDEDEDINAVYTNADV